MLSSDTPNTPAIPADSETLFSGLVRQSSEGGETVDHLSAVSAFGRCIAAGPDISVLLHDLCELAALVIQAELLLLARLTPDGKKLNVQIATFDSNRKAVVQSPDAISADPDVSMAAFAIHSADVIQSDDLITELRFTDLLLRRQQMGSGVFVPLCSRNRAFGALGLARKQSGPFTSDESNFTTCIAQLLGSHLAQSDAEKKQQYREATIKATLDSVGNLILTLDGQGTVREMNAAGVWISGFRDRELRDRPFWNTLIVPVESDRVAAVFRQAVRPGSHVTFDADLLSKDGQERAVRWSLCTMEVAEGDAQRYILSGIDGTELRECTRELEKFRRIAHGTEEAAKQFSRKPDRVSQAATPTGAEKRSSPRREFFYYQRIAPVRGDGIPADDEFARVICCDISAGGFSFLSEEQPTFGELVISLGTPPNDRKVIAKVVRVSEKDMDGQRSYQVGCQFLGRVGD